VLWLAPADPELGNRLRGQLVDTAWQLLERPAEIRFNLGDREAQLRAAFDGARRTRAQAVVWVRESPNRIQVLVLDVAHSRLSVRDVPSQVGDSAQQSAAFETAALIVRATLASIESGSVVGEVVSEPAVPPPGIAEPASQKGVTKEAAIAPPKPIAPWFRLAYRGSYNFQQILSGPALGAGVAWGAVRVGVSAHWALPFDHETRYAQAAAQRSLTLSLWRLDVALTAEHEWRFAADWAGFVGLQPGVALLHRSTSATAGVTPSADVLHVLPMVGMALGISGPSIWGVVTPELALGAQFYARIPELSLAPTPPVLLDSQMSRVEPWVQLAFRFP
jgi:hypothetical protein